MRNGKICGQALGVNWDAQLGGSKLPANAIYAQGGAHWPICCSAATSPFSATSSSLKACACTWLVFCSFLIQSASSFSSRATCT